MTEDRSGDGGVLLHGGHWVDGNDGGFLEDTWRWDGEAWMEVAEGDRARATRQRSGRLGRAARRDRHARRRRGRGRHDVQRHVAVARRLDAAGDADSPDPAQRAALAFDSKRQVLVLIGGIDRPGGTQRLDVWELDADGWHEVVGWPLTIASPRGRHHM